MTMEEKLRDRLSALNPGMQDNYPAFDYEEALTRIKRVCSALSVICGQQLMFGTDQDATYYADIALPAIMMKEEVGLYPTIRFSSFENLVAITCEEKLTGYYLDNIHRVLDDNEFEFVPFSIFGTSYEDRELCNGDLFNQLFDYV